MVKEVGILYFLFIFNANSVRGIFEQPFLPTALKGSSVLNVSVLLGSENLPECIPYIAEFGYYFILGFDSDP